MRNLVASAAVCIAIAAVAADVPVRLGSLGSDTQVYAANMMNPLSPVAFTGSYTSLTNGPDLSVFAVRDEERAFNFTNYLSLATWNDNLAPAIAASINLRPTEASVRTMIDAAVASVVTNLVSNGLTIDGHVYRLVEVVEAE